MGNVSKRFFIVLFEMLLMFIVLVNYLGWSGGYIDIIGGTNNNWGNSYFGFQSLYGMVGFLDKAINSVPFLSIDKFYDHLLEFQNIIVAGLPKLLSAASTDGLKDWQVIEWVKLIATILFQPIIFIGYAFLIIAHLVYYSVCLIATILQAFAGYYNLPMEDMPQPYSSEFGNFAPVLSQNPLLALGV